MGAKIVVLFFGVSGEREIPADAVEYRSSDVILQQQF
jgi:hypothetical protein